jgi:hypothetical protein
MPTINILLRRKNERRERRERKEKKERKKEKRKIVLLLQWHPHKELN